MLETRFQAIKAVHTIHYPVLIDPYPYLLVLTVIACLSAGILTIDQIRGRSRGPTE